MEFLYDPARIGDSIGERNMISHFNFTTTVSIAATILVCATFAGCAKDGARNPLSEFFESPRSRLVDEIKPRQSISEQPTIQQTSYEAKVSDPRWLDSLPEAIAEAQAESKLILLDFTGSDWCHYCVKLKKEIFETPEFKSWASDNVVLLELDFPRRSQLSPQIQQQNEMLKSRYDITSYPTVLLVDVEGNVKAKMGYQKGQSPAQWVQVAESRLHESSTVYR